jgi:hypothetical protein
VRFGADRGAAELAPGHVGDRCAIQRVAHHTQLWSVLISPRVTGDRDGGIEGLGDIESRRSFVD